MRTVFFVLVALLFIPLIFFFVLFVFDLFPLSGSLRPGQVIRQPAEFVPGLIFLVASVGYLFKGHWRVDAFEHWLIIGMLMGVMAHGAYMPFSSEYHDAVFVAGLVGRASPSALAFEGQTGVQVAARAQGLDLIHKS